MKPSPRERAQMWGTKAREHVARLRLTPQQAESWMRGFWHASIGFDPALAAYRDIYEQATKGKE